MAPLLRFRHFQSRLLVFFLAPLLAVLVAVYVAVTRANLRNALDVINDDLAAGARSFMATIALRNEALAIAGDALSYDYATREVVSTNDPPTILSAMQNSLERIPLADFIIMVDEDDDQILANTLNRNLAGTSPSWLALIEQARAADLRGEFPEATDVVILEDRPYLLNVIPFFTPEITAWIGLGFELDQAFLDAFSESIAAEISVVFNAGQDKWQSNGSTLDGDARDALVSQFGMPDTFDGSNTLSIAGVQYVTRTSPIMSSDAPAYIVLQRSLAQELAPFEALRQALFTIFALGFVTLGLGVLVISRKVTRPVQELAAGASRIEAGDYQQTVDIPLHDEIGELAQAFNSMARGLAEKEKVRNLLGKVVSPEIASELLSRGVELGGEEREVTILFSDVRGFTSLCEGQSPQQILALLNEYFSAITAAIEANGGVVDKFIGDAVMALFGAPVAQPDAAERAVRTAVAMERALVAVNASFAARGLPQLGIGIGIHTGNVVAGNMGSPSRLNYTVIGDGVNLASRLEGLTKQYGATIIASEACMRAAPCFAWRELGETQVKGRQETVRIFTPLDV